MPQEMTNLPNPDKTSANAAKQAELWAKDDALARAKGAGVDQIEARRRVAKLFCDIHFPADSAEVVANRLAFIDYSAPVITINGRAVNLENAKAKGLFGLGRKPAYLVSSRFPPQKPEDPIYVLEYFPVKA
jgi:hypothetical protein